MATTSEEMYASQEKPVPEVLEDSSAESLPDDRGDDAQVDDYSLSGAKLHIIIFGLGLAVFLMALDMSILATAIPQITEKFQSTKDISWYMSAYSLSI
jgi:hypothetical protein